MKMHDAIGAVAGRVSRLWKDRGLKPIHAVDAAAEEAHAERVQTYGFQVVPEPPLFGKSTRAQRRIAENFLQLRRTLPETKVPAGYPNRAIRRAAAAIARKS